VEAARAGEQGRGFAVVASEVRTLAQRSAAAAKEIKTLIDDSVGKVAHGNQLVGEAGQTMKEIMNSVRRVAGIMNEIAAASREQSNGIDQVTLAVSDMDEGTQQNAAMVEQAAAAAASLDEQATQLSQAVSVFKLVSTTINVPPATLERLKAAKPVARKVQTTSAIAPRGAARPSAKVNHVAADGNDWEQF
jgi:methyl-accepting chemotaxis protein